MTAALDAIARLDDGAALAGDRELADAYDWASSVYLYRAEQRLERFRADRCVICDGPDGPECDSCTAGHDHAVSRSGDL